MFQTTKQSSIHSVFRHAWLLEGILALSYHLACPRIRCLKEIWHDLPSSKSTVRPW